MIEDGIAETYDSADEQAERNQRREEQRRERADADVMRTIIRTKQGRAWLARKLVDWHLLGEEFYPGQPDVTAFRLGEKNCARRLDEEAKAASIDLYFEMLREQQAEIRRIDNLRREERLKREAAAQPPTPEDTTPFNLTPPAGYPGGPKLPNPGDD